MAADEASLSAERSSRTFPILDAITENLRLSSSSHIRLHHAAHRRRCRTGGRYCDDDTNTDYSFVSRVNRFCVEEKRFLRESEATFRYGSSSAFSSTSHSANSESVGPQCECSDESVTVSPGFEIVQHCSCHHSSRFDNFSSVSPHQSGRKFFESLLSGHRVCLVPNTCGASLCEECASRLSTADHNEQNDDNRMESNLQHRSIHSEFYPIVKSTRNRIANLQSMRDVCECSYSKPETLDQSFRDDIDVAWDERMAETMEELCSSCAEMSTSRITADGGDVQSSLTSLAEVLSRGIAGNWDDHGGSINWNENNDTCSGSDGKAVVSSLCSALLMYRQPVEGQLCKYTNVVTGWQYRWFVLNPDIGKLEYFEKEEHKKQRPRGYLSLAGAVICPSDEDEQTFTVNALNSASYRLKAFNAKDRQHWVNRLRATAEHFAECTSAASSGQNVGSGHTDVAHAAAIGQHSSSIPPLIQHGGTSSSHHNGRSLQSGRHFEQQQHGDHHQPSARTSAERSANGRPFTDQRSVLAAAGENQLTIDSSLQSCVDQLTVVQRYHQSLTDKIESLPTSPEFNVISALDKDMLLLKATSEAMLTCLQQCLTILQQQASLVKDTEHGGGTLNVDWLASNNGVSTNRGEGVEVGGTRGEGGEGGVVSSGQSGGKLSSNHASSDSVSSSLVDACGDQNGVEDAGMYTDTDLSGLEEHKNIILHLLSQLKLGMDLTKVVLPTFILEKRSLLEMFADCMAHPQLFFRIPHEKTPEARMIAVLAWYLTSFHAGRHGCIAKKPYNPIIGEHFHCSWQVTSPSQTTWSPVWSNGPDTGSGSSSVTTKDHKSTRSKSPGKRPAASSEGTSASLYEGTGKLYYCAEQVSHHPPISAFYFESPDNQMYMDSSIWTRSKFMGMSIGVAMIGKVHLRLLSHGEGYDFSLPSAYARSILTVPWVEFGDKVTIQCDSTGYTASVVFHTKPFYGGKLHKVTAEVRNPSGEVVCRAAGEWNGAIEFTHVNTGVTRVIDTAEMEVHKKCVRPLNRQMPTESRKLWHNVTTNLHAGVMDKATEYKQALEARQREDEKRRMESKTPFPTKFFERVGDEWIFKNRLKPLGVQ